MQRFYPHIAAGAGVLILVLILWGPTGGEESSRDSIVWQEDWEVIEYYASPDDKYAALRLIREPGLIADEYFVESPATELAKAGADESAGDEQDANATDGAPEYVRRRGGPTVTNIFRDWRRPKLNAYHQRSPERETEFGLNEPEHIVRFYESSGGDAVELRAGVKSGGANRFVTSSYYDHEGLLLIIGSYLFDKFTQGPFTYREKRILYYPTGSYTGEIRVRNEAGEKLRLTARQEEREQGGPLTLYQRQNEPGSETSVTDIPLNIASPLDAAVKSLMIQRFRDEPEAREFGDAEQLWEQAGKNWAEIDITIAEGDSYWIHLRQAPAVGDEDLVLIRSSVSMGTDWARRTAVENALRHMQIIGNYIPPEPEPEIPEDESAGEADAEQ